MGVVTTSNFSQLFPEAARHDFWHKVELTVRDVFHGPTSVVSSFKNKMQEAPIEEQMLVFGEEPLKVAADLVRADLDHFTEDQWTKYRRLIGSKEPDGDALPD